MIRYFNGANFLEADLFVPKVLRDFFLEYYVHFSFSTILIDEQAQFLPDLPDDFANF